MRKFWILPHRHASEPTHASDGENTFDFRIVSDPNLRPKGSTLGIPTSLLNSVSAEERPFILYAERYLNRSLDQNILCLFAEAQGNEDGTPAFLGICVIQKGFKKIKFSIPFACLPLLDQIYAKNLLLRLSGDRKCDPWVESVYQLMDLDVKLLPATNVKVLNTDASEFQGYTEIPNLPLSPNKSLPGNLKIILILLALFLGFLIILRVSH